MKTTLATIIVIAAMGIVAPAIAAHKSLHHHHAQHAKAGCKGEFMYITAGGALMAVVRSVGPAPT